MVRGYSVFVPSASAVLSASAESCASASASAAGWLSSLIVLPKDVEGIISGDFEVNVDDILNMDINGKEIVEKSKYPLLNRTLVHSFTYLFLRLIIEKKLVEKYKIDTSRYTQLGQIISQAFPDNADKTAIKNRVMLTSKKTLLNEFNHFEGNMSIFQPAIDITDHMLEKERTDILEFVNNL